MKIPKQLHINGETCELINDQIRLDLFAPGRALITFSGDLPQPGALVEINAGTDDGPMCRLFYGYAEAVTEIRAGVYQVLARELAATMNRRLALNVRHCTPAQVLSAISLETGLQFVLPNRPWVNDISPRFQHIGGGYMALDRLLQVWKVQRGVWLQQSDGQVFVGELEQSLPGSRSLSLPANLFKSNTVTGGTLPLIPRLRPGVHIEHGGQRWVITQVEISGIEMRLQWTNDTWVDRLKAVI